jgi:hypothetical protein
MAQRGRQSKAPPDADAIRRTLTVLTEPGQVVEVRGLDASTPRHRYPHTISGYFRDLDKCAEAAAKADPYSKGVYVTLNVLKPALLSRAANRARAVAKNEPLTADHDVERRRWFPIDCDPVRPAGISATEAEHAAGLQRSRAIADVLRAEGWPDPVMGDAGNSGHLLYPIDLPNDDASRTLIERGLEGLAFRFDDAAVRIDTGVYNAARVWRLYGTWNRKGDDTDDRPHRRSAVLDVPEPRVCVAREQLEALAQTAPRRDSHQHQSRTNGRFLDIAAWLAARQVGVDGPTPWRDGRKWVFPVCPWNASHTNSSAYLIQFADGGLDAGCHHNGCQGKNWPALRDVLEPDWRHGGPASDQDAQPNGSGAVDPWQFIKDAPTFLAEPQPEFEGLAKDLLAPGAITMLAAPRGLGKTQVAHSVGVALATAGIFRGERVKATRVLLLDRDNPEYVIRERLRAWGADVAEHLHILTRQHAPSLRDRAAWDRFPLENFDVVIMDAVGSFTEGITEKEGKQTTEVLATIIDVARKGLAVLLLQNATKDGLNFKGREEWADRVDIIYELRDATDFVPTLKRPWWEELPEAHEGAWAARAARRKGRDDFRLAFIASKYRLGPEPEPFALELHLPAGEPWTLADVTETLQASGEAAQTKAHEAHQALLADAAQALYALVIERHAAGDPLLKTQAEIYLNREQEITQREARQVIKEHSGGLWDLTAGPRGRGKGPAQILIPLGAPQLTPMDDDRINDVLEAASDKAEKGVYSVTQDQSERQNNPPASPCGTGAPENVLFCHDSGVFTEDTSTEQQFPVEKGSVGDMCLVCQENGKISHLYLTLDGGRECLRCLRVRERRASAG